MSADTIEQELTSLMGEVYEAFASGDPSPWIGRLAREHEVVSIGSDPDELWVGRDEHEAVINAQIPEMHEAGMQMTGGDLRVGGHADTAWAVDQPTLTLPDGSKVATRLSVVAVREDGELRLVQTHLSIGISNEQMLGQELTI